MALNYPPFAACLQMQKAAKSAPSLRLHSRGTAVALLQAALKDRGESLPTSFKHGVPDGAFGGETKRAVISYQTKKKLGVDGIAGKDTIAVLDADMVKASPTPSAPPSPILPSPAIPPAGSGQGIRLLR